MFVFREEAPTATFPAPVVFTDKAPAPTLVLLARFPPPSPILTPLTVISLLVVKADPVIETEPVKVCVLDKSFPKMLDPEE